MNVALYPRSDRLDLISLCTGGGGLDLACELAIPAARSVVMVEREAFAVAHLVEAMEAGLLAPAAVWSDVRSFDGRPWRGLVDGLIGGIPCQPHSLAGRKRGSLDHRDLWSPARRIIAQARPWFVLIENVAGMLAAGADDIAGAERVWRDLQRMGYAVEGGLFRAREIGAPHERERLFILGLADAASAGRRQPGSGCEQGRRSGSARRLQSGRLGGEVLDVADDAGRGWRNSSAATTGQADQRADRGGGCELADTDDAGLEGYGRPLECAGERAARPGLGQLVDAEGIGRRERRAATELRRGRDAFAGADGQLDDADRDGYGRRPSIPIQPRRQDEAGADLDRPSLFPPGPGDADGWRAIFERSLELLPALSGHDRFGAAIRAARLAADGDPTARQALDPQGPYGLRASLVQEIAQSSLRGLADGMAATRIDWLRLLGNGVVPLQGAYAIRTLGSRLAARGAPGATRLVRMMEAAE